MWLSIFIFPILRWLIIQQEIFWQRILLFLNLSRTHKNNGTSFVIVCKGVEIDSIPEELAVVPTIEEALDVLEMDAIERDLGF